MTPDKAYIISIDAGGTMTDCFLVDEKGGFVVGKALTNKQDESSSYLESVKDAARLWNEPSSHIHRKCQVDVYTGTTMLNAILTGIGRKVGFLTTRGFETTHLQERGLTWLGVPYEDRMHQQTRIHNTPLVPLKMIHGITESISGGSYYGAYHYLPGKEVIPLNEQEVREAVEKLLQEKVEAIAICFIYSYVNPAHEVRAAEIARELIQERGVNVQVVTSHEVSPVIGELQRTNSTIVEAMLGEPSRRRLLAIEEKAKEDGYRYNLLTVLAYGGTADIRYPRQHETIISGPIGGVIGGMHMTDLLGVQNALCCDMGGTSFDTGLIVRGRRELNKEADFARRRFALPQVSVESISAGTGMTVTIEPSIKRILLGPKSAGSDVGKCFRYPTCTISDVNVALGYLNPDYFLGGRVKLDKNKALEALQEEVARPLDKTDPYPLGEEILGMVHSAMRDHLNARLEARGYDIGEQSLFVYGGSGPLHMWGIAEGMNFRDVVTFPWAAGFSAFGNACADVMHRVHRGVTLFVYPGLPSEAKLQIGQSLTEVWKELEDGLYRDFTAEGHPRDKVVFAHGVYVRYIGQMEGIEVFSPVSRIESAGDLDKLASSFEQTYSAFFPEGARFTEAGYFISEAFVEGVVQKLKPIVPKCAKSAPKPRDSAHKGSRKVYYKRRWIPFDLWEMSELQAGNRVRGPAIIEDPMTTLVIPPGKQAEFDEYRVIHYGNQS